MARDYYTAPAFDQHQFQVRSRPVSVRYMGLDRWDTTGLSFEDYSHGHKEEHALFINRRISPPSFAVNTSEMKIVLARYFELRAGMRTPKIGTPEWRLKIALRKIQKNIPRDREVLSGLNREYVELKRTGGDPERLRKLENVIRALNGEIQMAKRGVASIVALIYFHFRLGYSSPQTAAELAIFPQTVRQTAFRLTRLWEKMRSDQDRKPTKKEIANAQVREHRRNFTPEQREAVKKYLVDRRKNMTPEQRDAEKKYNADYRKANREVLRANCQRWRNANREVARKQTKEATSRWLRKKRDASA